MSKQDFLAALRKKLKALPGQDLEESLNFYSELIDDRMDEGLSEEEAVAAVGPVEDIAAQILAEARSAEARPSGSTRAVQGEPAKEGDEPYSKPASRKSVKAWEIVLLVLGSPIWLSLLIAAFVVILALFVVLWSAVAVVWSVFAALCAGAAGGVAGGIVMVCLGNVFAGLALMGGGIACGGLAIFLFFGCLAATKGTAWLTKFFSVSLARGLARGFAGIFKREREV